MREILFRGKSIRNSEWVQGCGFIFRLYGAKILYEGDDLFIDEEGTVYPYYENEDVVYKTVGQYIGMDDRNGAKIFDGDILKVSDSEETHIGVVTYSYASWCIENETGRLSICDILKMNDKGAPFLFEVLGNIHDNPELLSSCIQ